MSPSTWTECVAGAATMVECESGSPTTIYTFIGGHMIPHDFLPFTEEDAGAATMTKCSAGAGAWTEETV